MAARAARATYVTIWPKDSKPETRESVEVDVIEYPSRHVEITARDESGVPFARITLSTRQALRLSSAISAANDDL